MKPAPKVLLVVASIATARLMCVPGSARAATVVVPPVTITQLTQVVHPPYVDDVVSFGGTPEVGYTSDGFTATIATGDTVVIRFQATPGKKFVVHSGYSTPGIPEKFHCWAYWQAGGGSSSLQAPYVETFEDFAGTMPPKSYELTDFSYGATVVEIMHDYLVIGDFEFTALQFKMVVNVPGASGPLTYSSVRSGSGSSFGTNGAGDASATMMEIVDTAVPTTTTTWGRLKTLYR
jgi:hypothetical protein